MEEFTLGDVYELAASIGQEMEQLIKCYGQDSVEQLMPSVVKVLEQLELLTERRQRDAITIEELKIEKEKLVIETRREQAKKRQLQEKVDYLESLVTDDVRVFQERLSDLQDQNSSLREEMDSREEEVLVETAKVHNSDVALMVKMKTTIDEQRDNLRQLNIEIDTKALEQDAFQQQIVRLIDINERLRLYNEKLRIKLDLTSTQKAEAQAQLTMQPPDVAIEDIVDGSADMSPKAAVDSVDSEERETSEDSQEKGPETAEQHKAPLKKDPNRPRYTLGEMQQVLTERNSYKEKLSVLEEELLVYKSCDALSQSSNNNNIPHSTPRASSPLKRSFSIWKFFPSRNNQSNNERNQQRSSSQT